MEERHWAAGEAIGREGSRHVAAQQLRQYRIQPHSRSQGVVQSPRRSSRSVRERFEAITLPVLRARSLAFAAGSLRGASRSARPLPPALGRAPLLSAFGSSSFGFAAADEATATAHPVARRFRGCGSARAAAGGGGSVTLRRCAIRGGVRRAANGTATKDAAIPPDQRTVDNGFLSVKGGID